MIFYAMTIFYLLTFIVCGAYVLLIAFYLTGWNKTIESKIQHPASTPIVIGKNPTIVSIILPARNEEQNILQLLDCLYKQTFPLSNFEIIVVDDHSTDRTSEVVRNLNIPNLKLIHLSEKERGKKQAITSGINHSSGHLIITTDADCEMGQNWLSSIVSFYEENKPKMIVSPVILKEASGFFSGIQSQEMIALTATACGSLYYNMPILCSGANLAYEREAFIAANGFEGLEATATGDDVFLMLKIRDKFPRAINYLKSSEATVFTKPAKQLSGVISQRKRWASKTFLYKQIHVIMVAVSVFFINSLILLSGLLSVINYKFAVIFFVSLFVKFIIDFMFLYVVLSFFNRKFNPALFVISSLIYPVYVTFVGLVSPFFPYTWKGRKS